MFNSISWSVYFECIFLSCLVYYASIILIYYRKDIQLKFVKIQQPASTPIEAAPVHTKPQESKAAVDDNNALFSTVHDLMEELKIIFQTAEKKQFPKEELLTALQMKLKDYPPLKGTAFQVAINNHIMQQAAAIKIMVEDNEVKNIW